MHNLNMFVMVLLMVGDRRRGRVMREEIEINYTYFGFEMTYGLVGFQILQLCLTPYESWIWAKYNSKFLDEPNK